MKILWFVNIIPSDYAKVEQMRTAHLGCWMEALKTKFTETYPSVQLSIAFAGQKCNKVKVGNVIYYSLRRSHLSTDAIECVADSYPDIIHCHGTDGIALSLPLDRFKAFPIVVSIQGVISGSWPHYSGGISNDEMRTARNIARELLGLRRIGREVDYWRTKRSANECRVFNMATMCLGRTNWDKAWVRALAPKIEYSSVGEILREEFYWGMRNQECINPHTIFCSSAFSYSLKGGHWLIRAIAYLKEKYPDIMLHVANGQRVVDRSGAKRILGQNEYYRFLNKLIDDLGVRGHIKLLPELDSAGVRNELTHAEVFCLPSQIENSPNSLGEAMMLGVPIIATYVGGIPSMIENNVSGLLIPSSDAASMASAIDDCFSNPIHAQELACEAYRRAQVRFNPSAVVEDLFNAYKRVCK